MVGGYPPWPGARRHSHQFTNTDLAKSGRRAFDGGCLIRAFATYIAIHTNSRVTMTSSCDSNRTRMESPNLIIKG